MRGLFLDTSGWLAALSPKEAANAAARAAYRAGLRGRQAVVTTNLVVAEMHAMLLRRRGTPVATRFLEDLFLDPSHEVVLVDRDLERDAIEHWIVRFRDVPISLADATSFEVMRQRGIGTVLTLDRHFTMAGFEAVPATR